MAKRKNSKKSDVPKLSLIDLKSKEIQADAFADSGALPVTSPATEIKTASVRFDGHLHSGDETEYETLSDDDDFDAKGHYYDFIKHKSDSKKMNMRQQLKSNMEEIGKVKTLIQILQQESQG